MCKRALISLVVLGLLLATVSAAKAQIVKKSQIAEGVAAGGAAIAAIVITIYYVHKHSTHTLRGCAVSGADGLQVQNEGDKQSYSLTGDTSGIKASDRVKLSGKKMKIKVKNGPAQRQFEVSKVSKDYGACKVQPATP